MKVVVVGTGYVGLVTGVCLADKGHVVTCVDRDESRVAAVNEARAPFFERGVDELLARNAGTRLNATTDLAGAMRDAELSLIAVGTPFDGSAIDLTAVESVARELGRALRSTDGYHVVCVKSTVVPGTTDSVVLPIVEQESGRRVGRDLGVAMNPEFLTEGRAVDDFMHPDRLVFGGIDERSIAVLEELYAGFPGVPRVRTNPRTAEMIKYASNALLATMISFSNEIADLASAQGGIDVVDVMHGVHASRYLTPLAESGETVRAPIASFLEAGCGFGGSCLPKDVSALAAQGHASGVATPLLDAVLDVNARRADVLVGRLERHVDSLEGLRVAVLGLAFKPDTDDVRESPAISVIDRLLARGAKVGVHDPAALGELEALFDSRAHAYETLEEAVADADALVLVTRWQEYERLPELLAAQTSPPLLVDGRRLIDRNAVARYDGIGL
jgi:UDPglucose 6-dehydrogenase/GDP-mannose 6-dehydrogenase